MPSSNELKSASSAEFNPSEVGIPNADFFRKQLFYMNSANEMPSSLFFFPNKPIDFKFFVELIFDLLLQGFE